jgi:hypothetical protein
MKVTHVRPNSGMIVRSGRPNRFPFLMQRSLLVSCLLATKAREHQLPSRGPCRGLNRVSQSYVTGSFAFLDSYQHLSGFWWFWTPVAPKDIELKLMIFESLWVVAVTWAERSYWSPFHCSFYVAMSQVTVVLKNHRILSTRPSWSIKTGQLGLVIP